MAKKAIQRCIKWGARGALLALLAGGVYAQPAQDMPLRVVLVASESEEGQNGLGNEVKAISEVVLEDYNASGIGPYIELDIIDADKANEKILREKIPGAIAVLSCAALDPCLQQTKTAADLGVPLVGPMSGAQSLLNDKTRGTVFGVRPSDTQMLQTVLQTMGTMRIKKLGVLVQKDSNGKNLQAELAALTPPKGLELITPIEIEARSPFATIAQQLHSAGATAVLLLSDDIETASALMRHLHAQRKSRSAYTPMIMHMPSLAVPEYAEQARGYPGGAMFATVVPSPWGGRTAAQRGYQSLAQTRGIYRANYQSFEAYLNAQLLLQAITKSQAKTPAQLRQYLMNTRIPLGGMAVQFTNGSAVASGFMDQAALGVDGSFRH